MCLLTRGRRTSRLYWVFFLSSASCVICRALCKMKIEALCSKYQANKFFSFFHCCSLDLLWWFFVVFVISLLVFCYLVSHNLRHRDTHSASRNPPGAWGPALQLGSCPTLTLPLPVPRPHTRGGAQQRSLGGDVEAGTQKLVLGEKWWWEVDCGWVDIPISNVSLDFN